MSQSESTMKTPASTTKRFHLNVLVNHVLKYFPTSKHNQKEIPKPRACTNEFILISIIIIFLFSFLYLVFTLPSISVTSPEGETTPVE